MTRADAEATVRESAKLMVGLELQSPDIHRRVHGATLLLTQALATSIRMPDGPAIEALVKAAELAGEVLLTRTGSAGSAGAVQLELVAGDLVSLGHRYVIAQANAANPTR